MNIVSGSAIIISDDEDNGREVNSGDCWRFLAGGKHGLKTGPEGLVFISTNGDIVDTVPENWDIAF